MSLLKALLLTVLLMVVFSTIQLSSFYVSLLALPSFKEHNSIAFINIFAFISAYILLLRFFDKSNFEIHQLLNFKNYNATLVILLAVISVGDQMMGRPFWHLK